MYVVTTATVFSSLPTFLNLCLAIALLVAVRHYSRARRALAPGTSECPNSRTTSTSLVAIPPKDIGKKAGTSAGSAVHKNNFQHRRSQSLASDGLFEGPRNSRSGVDILTVIQELETQSVAIKETARIESDEKLLSSRRQSLDVPTRLEVAPGRAAHKRASIPEWGSDRSRISCTTRECPSRLGTRRPSVHSRELSIALLQVCVSLLHVAISIPFSVAFPIFSAAVFAPISLPVNIGELSSTANVSTFIRKCVGLAHIINFFVYIIQVSISLQT